MTDNNLTIRFSPDGFSFNNDQTFEIAPGAEFWHNLETAILEQLPPGESTGPICCEVETTRVMLLPPEIKDIAYMQEMFDLTLSQADYPEQLLTQSVTLPKTGQEVTLCFGINREQYNFMLRNYEDLTFSHPLATMLTDADRMTQGNCLVVRCTRSFLEIALFRGPRLMLCNCFHVAQSDTRSYYVMNTWVQQQLDQLQDYLLVLGNGNEGLQIRASLHRFVKHVFS